MCGTIDRGNVFCMLAESQLRLSVNQVVNHCLDMRLSHPAHSQEMAVQCHHLFYFDTGKCALRIK